MYEENILTIYNPITLTKHTLNLEELRFWIDIPTLQHSIKEFQDYKNLFYSLENNERENLLGFLDTHEKKVPFVIKNWEGIPGFNVSFELNIIHSIDSVLFRDTINDTIKDNLFQTKKINTFYQEGNINIKNANFPINILWGISSDFHSMDYIEKEELLPVFERNNGSNSNSSTKILLDENSKISPIVIDFLIYTENQWNYNLRIVIESKIEPNNLIWSNIPKIKKLYDFFYEEGFTPKGDGINITTWEKGNTRIEYYIPSIHYHLPFVLVKTNNGKTDVKNRKELADKLIEKMNEKGLLEDLSFYNGKMTLTEALNKLTTKNKSLSDALLSEAIEIFDTCNDYLYNEAQIESLLCAWLKSRIAILHQDREIEYRCYSNMTFRLKTLRIWKEVLWLLEKIYNEQSKEMTFRIIKEIIPIETLDKHYFIHKHTYNRLLEYWEEAMKNDIYPKEKNPSEWHYKIMKEASDLGLQDMARKRFIAFCKETIKKPQSNQWIMEGTEELLNLAFKFNAEKEYLRFAKSMVDYFSNIKKKQSIDNLSIEDRKRFRWNSFILNCSESRWSFHIGYILSKTSEKGIKEIHKWYDKAYDSFASGMIFYDVNENYTEDQIKTIANAFMTTYQIGITLKDYNMMDYSLNLLRDLWDKKASSQLYSLINGVFETEEREHMAEYIVNNWIEINKDNNGKFILDISKIMQLSNIYISVEKWDEAVKTLGYGLKNFDWDYNSLCKIYDLYFTINSYSPEEVVKLDNDLFYWINVYQQETYNVQSLMPNLKNQIRKIKSI